MPAIPVVEIFGPTLQGEGPNVGARCIFVRVKGCSFSCSWCDSKFTWRSDSYPAVNYTQEGLADTLFQLCENSNCNRVVLTGGNPCLYDFNYVITSLKSRGRSIAVDVETQGDLLPEWLELVDTIVFSPKAPSSGMRDTYAEIISYIKNRQADPQQIAIKIPVFSEQDIEFARKYAKFLNNWTNIYDITLKLYLSVGNSDVTTTESIRDRVLADYEKLLNKINENPEDFENVFILPQLHTLVWGNKQGV